MYICVYMHMRMHMCMCFCVGVCICIGIAPNVIGRTPIVIGSIPNKSRPNVIGTLEALPMSLGVPSMTVGVLPTTSGALPM
jgi:hypothetical protein